MSASLFVRHCIICDDIRTEDNGKLILIGVFSGDILIPQPGDITFQFYFDCLLEGEGRTTTNFKLDFTKNDGTNHTSFKFGINVETNTQQPSDAGIPSPKMGLSVDEDLLITLLTETEGDWRKVIEKKIILQPQEDGKLT